jgi:ParB family chromosome partitioning protein
MAVVEEHKPAEKRRALGRGLDSLLPSGPRVVVAPSAPVVPAPVVIPTAVAPVIPEPRPELVQPQTAEIKDLRVRQVSSGLRDMGTNVLELPLDLIDENPYQTRRTFDEVALAELADSISASGLAQPVVVRPAANGRYVLVLGERRCRASKLAGKTSVPAIVRPLGNEQAAEMTIVENLQRQDLNCLEQAQAFARLSREFGLTQEQVAKRVGSSRESVANYMRLLKLPASVLDLVGSGKIQFSEARLLLEAMPFLDEAGIEQMARDAVQYEWTVKELKGRVNSLRDFGAPDSAAAKDANAPKPVDPNVKAAEAELQRLLGMRVRITDRRGKGTVVIQYQSVEDFERLLDVVREK